ncbi:MAG: AsmA-like C-terminal region-containing protein [Planctomycetaceae bacterium]
MMLPAGSVLRLSIGCLLVIALSTTATAQVAANPPAARVPAYRYWTTNWSFEDINVGRLLGRLRSIGVDVPIDAEGDVSVQFSVSIPLNGLRNGQAYRFTGTIASDRLRLERLELAGFRTNARYDAGVLTLSDLTTRWLDVGSGPLRGAGPDRGELAGEASLGIVPRGALTTSLTARSLAIGPLYDLILTASRQAKSPGLDGTVGGTLDASVPLRSLSDPNTWTMDADLQARGLSLAGTIPLSIATGPISLRAGKLHAANVRVASPADSNIRMVASLKADLANDRPFEFDVKANDLPLQSLVTLAALSPSSTAAGNLDLDAQGSGALGDQGWASARWEMNGRVASPELSILGLQLGVVQHAFEFDSQYLRFTRLDDTPNERVMIDRLAANYAITDEAANFDDVDAALFGGVLKGSAQFMRSQQGTHRLQMTWDRLRPRFDTSHLLPRAIAVSLRTSGNVNWSVPAASADEPSTHQGVARIAVDEILLGTASVGEAQLSLQSQDGSLQIQGEGELFGGRFSVETTTPLAAAAGWFDLSADSPLTRSRGKVDFNQISLLRASRAIEPRSGYRIDGFVSGEVLLDAAQTPQRQASPRANLSLTLDHLAINRTLLTQRLHADVRIDRDEVTIRSLRGSYAGGQVDTAGNIRLSDGRGLLQVRLAALDASRALMPVSLEASAHTGGILSGQLMIETGPRWRVRGAVDLRDSELASVAAGDAHAAVAGTVENDFSRWNFHFRSIQSLVEGGRITGDAQICSSTVRPGAFDLRSDWQARRLDFAKLLAGTTGSDGAYARGNLDGVLTLNGMGIRSAADLTGRFAAELDGTQARAVPGLVSAQAYLGAFSLADSRVEQGLIRGSIGAGIARIDEFLLIGRQLQMFAQGRVQIPSGRMDVTAVISTSNLDVENAVFASVAQQLAVGAVPPVAIFLEINRLLSNRTLYVDILGPLADPRLYLKPLATFESQLTRFLIRRGTAAILPVAFGGGLLAEGQDR